MPARGSECCSYWWRPGWFDGAGGLAHAGVQVDLYDAMSSVGRKFLLAGVGGMNLTHSEPFDVLSRYGARAAAIRPLLEGFSPDALRTWVHGLGVETFVGSSGRVFPADMKAAPLLHAWLHRLRESGVRFRVRHRWLEWLDDGALRFMTPQGRMSVQPGWCWRWAAAVGRSWGRMVRGCRCWCSAGSRSQPCSPRTAASTWQAAGLERASAQPLKTVALRFTDASGTPHERKGEPMLSASGMEGGLYALSAPLRDTLAVQGTLTVQLDLTPDKTLARIIAEVAHPRGARSLSSHLQSHTGIKGVKMALLRSFPGVFCAGEMTGKRPPAATY